MIDPDVLTIFNRDTVIPHYFRDVQVTENDVGLFFDTKVDSSDRWESWLACILLLRFGEKKPASGGLLQLPAAPIMLLEEPTSTRPLPTKVPATTMISGVAPDAAALS